jgi:hypothetical protein
MPIMKLILFYSAMIAKPDYKELNKAYTVRLSPTDEFSAIFKLLQ